MKKIVLLSVMFLPGLVLHSQTINWAVNTTTTPNKTKLTVDKASNLYLYGYTETYYPNEREGSIISKYNPDGGLMFTREWKDKFFISSMLNDGSGNFYFCGHFRDTVYGEGISLISNGSSDGFFGKMDENGKVAWTIGFGGRKKDLASDITFNQDSSEIVITGGVDSSFILYDYTYNNAHKAIFVARFNLAGGLQSYKTFAFTPNEYGDNIGWEIQPDGNNGYYMLASRMGDHWSNESTPSGSPSEGHYVFNLDDQLNIRWSTFIISSGCYYGYSCANIAVQNGQACVPSFCSGKYGGTGRLQKLEATGGSPTWSITNYDGHYYDTHASGKNLLYVGNEEANGCPCEDNNPGYARIKMLDENNEDKILLSKYAFHFYNITQAPNGNIYVFGGTWTDDPHLQGKSLEKGYFIFSMQSPPASYEFKPAGNNLLSAYPNPSSGYVEIINEKMIDEITIMNGNGTIIRSVEPEAKAWTIRDLDAGYYIVRLKDSEGYRSGKVLVNK
jgi:hypothetical protein